MKKTILLKTSFPKFGIGIVSQYGQFGDDFIFNVASYRKGQTSPVEISYFVMSLKSVPLK